jgi:integrase/recombinase XerD
MSPHFTPTLAQLATDFLSRPGLSPQTVKSYQFTLIPLLSEVGSFPVEIITVTLLEDYLSSLTHLSYSTRKRHYTIISSLFTFAVKKGIIKANPMLRITLGQPLRQQGEYLTDSRIRYLTTEQLQVLYQLLLPDVRLHTLVCLLHRSGTRISEILALDLEQINLDNRKFEVVGKGHKKRWCFYSQDAAFLLDKYIHFYRYTTHPALFTARHPVTFQVTRLSYSYTYSLWRNLIAQSPLLQGIRLHDLRHTFATERVGLMGIEELRALMGHEHLETTLRYQKVTSQRAELIAHKALDFLINDSPETLV